MATSSQRKEGLALCATVSVALSWTRARRVVLDPLLVYSVVELQSGFSTTDEHLPQAAGAQVSELRRSDSQGIGNSVWTPFPVPAGVQFASLLRGCRDYSSAFPLSSLAHIVFFDSRPSFTQSQRFGSPFAPPPGALQVQSPDLVTRGHMIHRLSTCHTRTIRSLIHRGEQTSA